MTVFLIIFYSLFVLFVALLCSFVWYHLRRYSINPRLTRPLVALFFIVTVILMIINASFFFSIPFDDLLPSGLRL